jgi:nucleoside-diphosphate-sugar epimerase
MNMNVFQAAIDAGVRKIVFASSIQVVSSESHDGTALPHAHKVAYLPLDADSPANPTNGYALSKLLGEVMLREYVAPCGILCAAMRFPALRASAAEFETDFTVEGPHKPVRIAQGFALLTMNDAARSIIATLEAKLTGYHTFFPAISRVEGALVKPAIERYYPDVPLRRPIEQIDSLVCSRFIREATGWVPQDLF